MAADAKYQKLNQKILRSLDKMNDFQASMKLNIKYLKEAISSEIICNWVNLSKIRKLIRGL